MKTKIYFLFALLFMAVQTMLFAQEEGYIMFVSDNSNDSGFINLLEENLYTVYYSTDGSFSRLLSADSTLEAPKIDTLEGAALIILSRSCATGDFDPTAHAGVDDQWNGFEVPLINFSAYLARNSRLDWFASATVACGIDSILVTSTGAASGIFEGMTPSITVPMLMTDSIIGTDDFYSLGTDGITVADAGNGDVIATSPAGTDILIAYFEEGVEFYGGAAQIAGTDRYFFSASRSDCDGGGHEPEALYNLNADGEQMFLNLVSMYVLPRTDGINTAAREQMVVSYPSPTADQLTIQGVTNISLIEVMSLNGAVVATFENTETINVSNLANGFYMLKVLGDNNQTYISKFVKK